MSKHRLTQAQRKLLDALRAGQTLHQQVGDQPFFLSGGVCVNSRTVNALAKANVLIPAQDGLFGGDQQSWVLS